MSSDANVLQPPTYESVQFFTSIPSYNTDKGPGLIAVPNWMKSAIDVKKITEDHEKALRLSIRQDGPPEQMKLVKLMDTAYDPSTSRKRKFTEQFGGGGGGNDKATPTTTGQGTAPAGLDELVPVGDVKQKKGSGIAKQCKCKVTGSGVTISKQHKRQSLSSTTSSKKKKKNNSHSSAAGKNKNKKKKKSSSTSLSSAGGRKKKTTVKKEKKKKNNKKSSKTVRTHTQGKIRKATKRPQSQTKRRLGLLF